MSDKLENILNILKTRYPNSKIALNYSNDWELLVAVILSAQCTDKKVNEVTAKLFQKYKHIKDFANCNLNEFEQDIRSTGFYHNKAKNILNAAKIIIDKYQGKVPARMNDLILLPGVARKTANIVLGNAFGIIEGIAVDTHVGRISQRLGLSKNSNPEKIEKDLMEILPQKEWFLFSYLLIDFGRDICDAKKPKCEICPLNNYCTFYLNNRN